MAAQSSTPARPPAQAGWARLRYLGLAGSVALAIGATRAGARAGLADRDGLPGPSELPAFVLCLAGLIALTIAWWRVGVRTASPQAGAPTGRWMLVTAAMWAAPVVFATPLGSRDIYAYACQGALVRAGLDPHRVGAAGLPCPWLDSVPPIWRDAPSPYGPLFGLLSAGAASADTLAVAVAALRLFAIAGVILATWYGRILARACGVPATRAAWLGLASPLVIVHAFSGAHNDAVVAGLVVAAFGIAASGSTAGGITAGTVVRVVAAGAALGGAVAVKATAVVVLPFLALILAGAPRVWRRLAVAALAVTATGAATYAALAAASGLGVGFLRGLIRTGELAQWTSVPTAVGMTVGYALRALGVGAGYDTAVTVARAAGLAVAAVAVAGLWWSAWRAGSVRHTVSAAGLALAALALLGPIFYPWYALTPVALLAVSIRDTSRQAWVGAASGVLTFLILPNGTGLAPRTKLPGALAVTVAAAAAVVRWLRGTRRRPIPSGS